MVDQTTQEQRRRGPGRPWKSGESGNPAGRPVGSGMSAKFRDALAADMPAILAAQIERAKQGDTAAARFLTDRMWPTLRAETMPLALPGLESGSLADRAQAALSAAGRGEVSIDIATAAVTAIVGLARIRETEEMEARLAVLEKASADKS